MRLKNEIQSKDSLLKIKIVNRNDADSIDLFQWQALAKDSLYANPFFEHWNLLPALKYLDKQAQVYIVLVYEQRRLCCLFPVVLDNVFGIRRLSFWKHDHCYVTQPLMLVGVDMLPILKHISLRFKSQVLFVIHCYSDFITNRDLGKYHSRVFDKEKRQVIIQRFTRAYYSDEHLPKWPENLSAKQRREHKRLIKKIGSLGDVAYDDSNKDNNYNFERFCKLERAGWKGEKGTALLCKENDLNYFRQIACLESNQGRVTFQTVCRADQLLAISFRYILDDRAFEIKTTFNEEYRKFQPGVILEIHNLNSFCEHGYRFIDSCAASDNTMINRLWPHQISIINLFWFNNCRRGHLIRRYINKYLQYKSIRSDNFELH